mmetsp:Transcript_13935/g.22154  ORF Transcript_13935/g.22154 Transcript_13935/m.22154 type:complete len:264 (+) Transcript_13935:157-948(+)|eukprot:CAMPEP_0179415848 /NCGR_PEP_ID=MMETSP0799-20121207/6471_1 /TAXON_ID=46947 /ORGANISM="Geminigera cryophila, Strain CCMP2564" /LENGTH=263 /DNA_ID=CAMNT_0021188655 /DNA_START=144 /DNA_END=935 /DNA_ORIENTATION=+
MPTMISLDEVLRKLSLAPLLLGEVVAEVLTNLRASLRKLELGKALNAPIIGDHSVRRLVALLESNNTLMDLNLTGTEGCKLISAEGIGRITTALTQNTTLTSLSLGFNMCGRHGCYMVANALCCNASLSELEMGNNKIRDDGATLLAESLRTNTTLTKIDLRGNELYSATASRFGEVLMKRPPPPGGSLTLLGISLCQCAKQLDLPMQASQWSNSKILEAIWEAQRLRRFAFATALHPRLGAQSAAHGLEDEMLRMVLSYPHH